MLGQTLRLQRSLSRHSSGAAEGSFGMTAEARMEYLMSAPEALSWTLR